MKMACTFLFMCAIFSVPYLIICQGISSNGDEIIFHYNNTYLYNVPYTVYVNKNIEYVMEFAGDIDVYDTPARVTVASVWANRSYPVFITARQQKGVFSWQLPVLVQTPSSLEQFNNISRTLCPHNNLFSEDEDTCDVTTRNTPIIQLTSSSPTDIEVVIIVETVKDFYIKLNSTTNFTSAPSQPMYYFFPFKQESNSQVDLSTQKIRRNYICNKYLDGEEERRLEKYFVDTKSENSWFPKSKSVIVMIESDDDVCAVVSIQNFSCPVFDNERDILYDGYYLTMTRRGGITLTQDTFPIGFYIVFIVKTSDEDCIGTTSTNVTLPTMAEYFGWNDVHSVNVSVNYGRIKKFSFRIIATISYAEYLIAAGVVLVFFVSFYVAFIVAIVCQRRRKNQANNNSMDTSQSEDRRLSPPATPHDEGSTPAASCVCDVMVASVETTSRHCLMGDGDGAATTVPECSSSSDTDSYSTLEDRLTDKDVYLHGTRLRLCDLARSRPRVLAARSNVYLYSTITVVVFYTLPVVQLVVTYQRLLNQSGNQDLCYFNFLCAHPLMMLTDFNHVYSNLGYVLLGFLFLIQVWRRHKMHKAKTLAEKELGIPQHFGILYAMGVALVSEGILSAAYHVCPNSMNFQFDTSFMYVTSILCMVKIYQSRHPDINARAHATFGVLALIIFVGLVGVLNANFYFWVAFTALHLVTCFVLTFHIYYLGRFKLDPSVFTRAFRALRSRRFAAVRPEPTRYGRCALLAIANVANWAVAAYGVAQHNRDFASHLLLVLMSNLFLYTLFYIVMKLLHRESILWYSWLFIALTYGTWFSSAYFYLDLNTNWAQTPAQSRQNNRVCSLLELYDTHDIWHFMSSVAMFFSFNMYLTIDDNLIGVARSDITPF